MPRNNKWYYGSCRRCGIETLARRHPICPDCRLALNKTEQERWR